MDFNRLVDEIVVRVLAKIAEEDGSPCALPKKKLLIITQNHGEKCHKIYESPVLAKYFQIDCAQLAEGEVAVADYDAAILFDLTSSALAEISCGFALSRFSQLAASLILSGKQIYVPYQEVELFKYKESAPAVYYAMMKSKLDFLAACGVIFCDYDKLEEVVCAGACSPAADAAPCRIAVNAQGKELTLTKRVINESDVKAAGRDFVKTIYIGAKTIVTDLAADYAHERGITLVRGQTAGGGCS